MENTLFLYKFILFLAMKIRGNLTYNSHGNLIEVALSYLHFMLELYSKNSYLIGTNSHNTRRISRKIVKENSILKQFTEEEVNSLFKILLYKILLYITLII